MSGEVKGQGLDGPTVPLFPGHLLLSQRPVPAEGAEQHLLLLRPLHLQEVRPRVAAPTRAFGTPQSEAHVGCLPRARPVSSSRWPPTSPLHLRHAWLM